MKTVLMLIVALACLGMGATVAGAQPKPRAKPTADAAAQLLRVETWGGGALTFRAPKGWKLDPNFQDSRALTAPYEHNLGKLTSADGITTVTLLASEEAQPLGIAARVKMVDLIAAGNPDSLAQAKISGREAVHLTGPSTDKDDEVVRIDLLAFRLDPKRVVYAYTSIPWSVAKSVMTPGGPSRLPGVKVLESIRVAAP